MARKPPPPPPPNWQPQTIWTGDNLDIMRGMNSESVDLIYLDPPFNSNADYAAPIGSQAAGAAFRDTWGLEDVKLIWHGEIQHEKPGLYALLQAVRIIHSASMMSYLIYMAVRIIEMERILKPAGSIYLHCDPTAGHYLKLLMDAVFTRPSRFRREIIWQMKSRSGFKSKTANWVRDHETLFFYQKSDEATFNVQKEPYSQEYIQKMFKGTDSEGRMYRQRPHKRYYADTGGIPFGSIWTDIHSFQTRTKAKEYRKYPTQKPVALLQRIIQASSNPNDIVFDPFCGCATACVAASILDRQWVGIDISEKAAELVRLRLDEEVRLLNQDIVHRTDIPQRTDLGKIPKYNSTENKKFLYGQQEGHCNGCSHHFPLRNLTIDHIVPQSKGGSNHICNLQMLCGACNSEKGTKSHEELIDLLTKKGYRQRFGPASIRSH